MQETLQLMFLIIQFQMVMSTDTATITITILGANDAPVAQNDVGCNC